jgi:hypothetical protein
MLTSLYGRMNADPNLLCTPFLNLVKNDLFCISGLFECLTINKLVEKIAIFTHFGVGPIFIENTLFQWHFF